MGARDPEIRAAGALVTIYEPRYVSFVRNPASGEWSIFGPDGMIGYTTSIDVVLLLVAKFLGYE